MKKIFALLMFSTFAAEAVQLPGVTLPQTPSLPKAGRPQRDALMNTGVVDSVDLSRSILTVYRNELPFDPQKIKVFRGKAEVGIHFIRQGQKIRYLLDSSGKNVRRIWIEE